MTIKWEPITEYYNETHKSRFTTKEMFKHLYLNIGNVEKVAEYLGVSVNALTRKMDLLNVPRMHKELWPESLQSKLSGIPTKKLAKMTAKEIADYLGCKYGSVYRALDTDGREYKRVKPQY